MSLIADTLLVAGALGATFYCFILSRRLSRFTNLENGMGGAVAVLSVQVDELTKALEETQALSKESSTSLEQLSERAESAAARLELLLAAMHDLDGHEPRDLAAKRARTAVHRNRRVRPAATAEAAE